MGASRWPPWAEYYNFAMWRFNQIKMHHMDAFLLDQTENINECFILGFILSRYRTKEPHKPHLSKQPGLISLINWHKCNNTVCDNLYAAKITHYAIGMQTISVNTVCNCALKSVCGRNKIPHVQFFFSSNHKNYSKKWKQVECDVCVLPQTTSKSTSNE